MTIFITGTYTVDAATTINDFDETTFELQADPDAGDPALDNFGEVFLTSASAGKTLAMIEVDPDAYGSVFNEESGVLNFAATGVGEQAFGVRYGGRASFANLGEFAVSSARGEAVGVFAKGQAIVANTGEMTIGGGPSATGVLMRGGGDFSSSGELRVSGSQTAVGVELDAYGSFSNAGVIRVDGRHQGAVGVQVDSGLDFFVNNGSLIATSKQSFASVGIAIHNPGDANVLVLENHGLIRADYAVREDLRVAYAAETIFDNFGKVFGTVLLGQKDDQVYNAGHIQGVIYMGAGHDLFSDGRHGDQSGPVFGGGGKDQLVGGDAADRFYGDGEMAKSDDADVLVGNGGADTLTGGGGADIFLYQRATDSTDASRDLITDLEASDRISLVNVDADKTRHGDQAFHLVEAFGGHAGELTVSYYAGPDLTLIQGDVNGDGEAELVISIDGDHRDFSNFTL